LAVSHGCLDEARFVCYGVHVMASNANIINCGAFSWTIPTHPHSASADFIRFLSVATSADPLDNAAFL